MNKSWALACLITASAAGAVRAEVPLRDFFEHAQFTDVKLSPDGKHLAFTYEEGSEVRLAVMDMANKKILSSFGYGEQMHVLDFGWGNNERVLMQIGKVTGHLDNTGRAAHLYAANVDGSKRRQIFELQSSGFSILHRLPQNPKQILIGKYHGADEGSVKPHLLNIYDGKLDYIADAPNPVESGTIAGLETDNAGQLRVGVELIEGESFDEIRGIVHVKGAAGGSGTPNLWQTVKLDVKRPFQPNIVLLGFSADNSRAYFASNHDMVTKDTQGVFEYDFQTGKLKLVYRHPEVDVQSVIRAHDGAVLGVYVMPGRTEAVFFDETHPDTRFLKGLMASFPNESVHITSYTDDGKKATVLVSGDRNPGEYFLFDVAAMKAKFLAARNPKLKAKDLVEMRPIRYKARDGLEIHGYLTLPKGQSKDLPLIVNVHGGPYGPYDGWGYESEAQFFASRGYAMLQVNFRGSGNYGDDFYRAGRKQWGHAMQDDVTDATRWAIEQGIADPKRICIYGGSYGGYATLWGVVKEPDLYRCAVGYVGVYDMAWFREGDGSDGDRGGSKQKKSMEQWSSAHLGDDLEAMKAVSPVHHVDRIKAELFIVHGEDDVRVPVGHAYRLKEALDKIGKKYEWLLVDKEGHGFMNVDNRVTLYGKMLAFFDQHIGNKAR